MNGHLDSCGFTRTGDLRQCTCEEHILRSCVYITLGITLLQLFVLWYSNSIALGADTVHVVSDLIVLTGYFLVAVHFRTAPTDIRTARRTAAAYGAIALLILGALVVAHEAYERLLVAHTVLSWPVLAVAALGGTGNLLVHQLLHNIPHEHQDHVHQAVHWHVIFDIAASAAVGVSAMIRIASEQLNVLTQYAPLADPVTALLIAAYMLMVAVSMARKVRSHASLL